VDDEFSLQIPPSLKDYSKRGSPLLLLLFLAWKEGRQEGRKEGVRAGSDFHISGG